MVARKREKLEVDLKGVSVSHPHQIHKSEAGNTRLHVTKSRSTCTEVAAFVPLTAELAGWLEGVAQGLLTFHHHDVRK